MVVLLVVAVVGIIKVVVVLVVEMMGIIAVLIVKEMFVAEFCLLLM